MAWMIRNTGALICTLVVMLGCTSLMLVQKTASCRGLMVEREQLLRAAAEAKIDAITWQMNTKEIEQERHEMELAYKGALDNLKLAKKVIRDYGMKQDAEFERQLPPIKNEKLREEIVKPRATGLLLPDEF